MAISNPFKMGLKQKYLDFKHKNLEVIIENSFCLKDKNIVKFIAEIWTVKFN